MKVTIESTPHGAIVIARSGGIVLCMFNQEFSGREYVVWEGNDKGGYYSGHYFQAIKEAVENYEARR